MTLVYTPSEPLTLGAEVELQILDAESRDLAPGAPRIFDALGGTRPHIKPELFQAMLEISTGICHTAAEVRRDLADRLADVHAAAEPLGLRLAAAGSHPFARHRDRLVYPAERYQGLIDRNRWITRRLMVFGLHVHVGVRDGHHAMVMINGLLPYLPHLLGLSASSPFWQGSDTGLASSRITVFEALPTAGHPCTFADWTEFEAVFAAMVRSGAITSIKDIYWDIRPHVDLGTVEIRICDGCPTLTETAAVVGLVHTLCAWIDERWQDGEVPVPPPMWMVRENKWRASRWGLEADLVLDPSGRTRNLREELHELTERLAPAAAQIGAAAELAAVRAMVRAPGSHERQRRLYERTQSFVSVAESLVEELASDRPTAV